MINDKETLIKIYDPYSRNNIDNKHFTLNNCECLIIEGVPALDIGDLRDIANINIYVDINEVIRKERFHSFYRWKRHYPASARSGRRPCHSGCQTAA